MYGHHKYVLENNGKFSLEFLLARWKFWTHGYWITGNLLYLIYPPWGSDWSDQIFLWWWKMVSSAISNSPEMISQCMHIIFLYSVRYGTLYPLFLIKRTKYNSSIETEQEQYYIMSPSQPGDCFPFIKERLILR